MGVWGAGLTQSDEYCEVYDSFMKKYDAGESPEAITDEILSNYLAEFEADDGILHDVYLALAKCQWMCGGLSDTMKKTVEDIIKNGKNLAFLKELDADEGFLKERKKKLDSFLFSLETPRKAPRKRKTPPKERPLPPANAGDVFCYKGETGLRVAVVLELVKKPQWRPGYFCCIFDRVYDCKPDIDTLMSEKIRQMGVYVSEEFLPASKIRLIGNLKIPPNKYEELFGDAIFFGWREDFYTQKGINREMTLEELLNAKNLYIFSF